MFYGREERIKNLKQFGIGILGICKYNVTFSPTITSYIKVTSQSLTKSVAVIQTKYYNYNKFGLSLRWRYVQVSQLRCLAVSSAQD